MSIDWDEVIDDASDSARALLAEVLAQADEIEEIIIVFADAEGHQSIYHRTTGTAAMIAMLEYAKWKACHDSWGRVHDEG